MKFSRQRGVGLIELMISLVIGMIVIAGALTMTSSTFSANASQMKMSRLNNELRMAMTNITRDMRRSGYHNWTIAQLTAGVYSGNPPFAPTVVVTSGSESVTVSYDENADSLFVAADETFGFRLQNNTIETRIGTTGTWSSILDSSVIQIDSFTITNLSQNIPTSTTGGTSNISVPMYSISITGHLINDTTVVRTIQETVRLRNVIVS